MGTRSWQVTEAILGKDVRQSRVLLLALILLFAASRFSPPVDRYTASLLHYALALLTVLWGAANGNPQDPKRAFERTQLPVSPYQLWLVSFGFPFLILSATALLTDVINPIWTAPIAADLSGTPVLLALFALSYLVSMISSQRFALAVGVLTIICAPTAFVLAEPNASNFAWGVASASSVAVFLFLTFRGMMRADLSRVLCMALPVTVIFAYLAMGITRSIDGPRQEPFEPHDYTAAYNTIRIRAARQGPANQTKSDTAEFTDSRSGLVHTHVFKAGWHAAWVVRGRIAYFLESDPARRDAKITEWDTRTDSVRLVLRLPLRPDFATLCVPGHFASVDKSGRYMIARLAGVQNSSVDLWLIDLKQRHGRVVMQNATYFDPSETRWLAGRALVPSYRSRVIEVDLSTWTAVYLSGRRRGD